METLIYRPSTAITSSKTPRSRAKQSIAHPIGTKGYAKSMTKIQLQSSPQPYEQTNINLTPLKLSFQTLLADVEDILFPIIVGQNTKSQFCTLTVKFENSFKQFLQNFTMMISGSHLADDMFFQKILTIF